MGEMIIIDTNILVDMILEDRERHQEAYKLYEKLKNEDVFVIIPYSGLFELMTVLNRKEALKKKLNFPGSFELYFKPVPIDDRFFDRYYDRNLPYTKTGDMLFLAIAKKKNLPLITEEQKLYNAAKKCGVKVFRIHQFVAS